MNRHLWFTYVAGFIVSLRNWLAGRKPVAGGVPVVRYPHWKFDMEYEELTIKPSQHRIKELPPPGEPIYIYCLDHDHAKA